MPLTVYKRGRFWWLTGTVPTRDGEQPVHKSTGETDEVKAQEIRLERENQAREELRLDPKDRFTFAQAVETYLNAGKDDRFILALLEHFKETRISDMTGSDVRAAAKKLYPTAVYTTWNRQVIIPTRAVINLCADDGKCRTVTIKGFTKKDRDIKRPSAPPKRAVDRSYIDTFREACDDGRLGVMMLFMFQTGARIGDAVNLEPEDLDLAGRKVRFRDMKNGEDGEADLTIEMVYELQEIAPAEGKPPHNRVFGFKHRWSVYKKIRATCTAAGIPYLGTHQPGRHSFATEMIVRNRVDVATTATKGRWKSKKVLVDHYPHAEQGTRVIDKVFGKKKPRRPANASDQRGDEAWDISATPKSGTGRRGTSRQKS